MKYMPQLDSVRALAVLLVIFSHWLPVDSFWHFKLAGIVGVTVFFVLSGYLITRILINSRDKFEKKCKNNSKAKSVFSLFKIFYIRRFLRIVPVYYLVLFVLFFLFFIPEFSYVREHLFYYLTYTSNFLYFFSESWQGYVSHFWTLAVEEQFYLIWPLVILLVPRKHLLKTMILFVFIGIVFRYILANFYLDPSFDLTFMMTLMPSCFDAFAIGAILAFLQKKKVKYLNFSLLFLSILSVLFIYLFTYGNEISIGNSFLSKPMFSFMYYFENYSQLHFIYNRFLISIVSAFIILKTSENIKGILGFILNLKALQYLGKISYGIYIYHNFIRVFLDTEKYFFLSFIIVILVSSLSWYLFEKPINNLKKRFEY